MVSGIFGVMELTDLAGYKELIANGLIKYRRIADLRKIIKYPAGRWRKRNEGVL